MSLKWNVAQEHELAYHKSHTEYRQSAQFDADSKALLEGISGDVVIDLGCGPKLRTLGIGKQLIAIDPLMFEYMKLGYSDVKRANKTYPLPAEIYLPSLKETADVVVCINVLDHVEDPGRVIKNAHKYLKPGGAFVLAVDLRERADDTHPHEISFDILWSVLIMAGFAVAEQRTIPSFADQGKAIWIKAVK